MEDGYPGGDGLPSGMRITAHLCESQGSRADISPGQLVPDGHVASQCTDPSIRATGSCWSERGPQGWVLLGGALSGSREPRRKVSEQDVAPVVFERGGRTERPGSSYLTMLQSGSIRTMVGSSTYRNSKSCWILALSTCTVTFMSSTSSEDVVLQMM